jgi:hypothetical protein
MQLCTFVAALGDNTITHNIYNINNASPGSVGSTESGKPVDGSNTNWNSCEFYKRRHSGAGESVLKSQVSKKC